ncbi:TPA: S24 family peptidase [Vibrio cholerae]
MKTAEENRIDNARYLARTVGGISAFAEKIEREPTQVSRFMGSNPTKGIGTKMARHIEDVFGMPNGWLDINHGNGGYSKRNFAERLNAACAAAGIPVRGRAAYLQANLPQKLSLVGIRRWLTGESVPDREKIINLAELLNVPQEELFSPAHYEVRENISNPYRSIVEQQYHVPLVSWVSAGSFCNSETQVNPLDCEMVICPNKSASKRTFALKVVGDSMTAPYGRSYPEGSIIFVDPEKVAEPGMRVIAKTPDGYTFKQLAINELGVLYLKPLNPHHSPIFGNDIEPCGVVIGSYTQD